MASILLVLFIAIAVVRLVTVQGKLVPDVAAKAQAQATEDLAASMKPCVQQGEQLVRERDLFNKAVAQAKLQETDTPGSKKKKPTAKDKAKETANEVAWSQAIPSYKIAIKLAQCKERTINAVGERAAATPAWDAILKAAEVKTPGEDDKPAQTEATKTLQQLLGGAPLAEVEQHVKAAEASLKEKASAQRASSENAMIREPLPKGVLSRQAAVGIGVGLCVLTLLLSYISVTVASSRRASTLIPLRDAARQGKAGLQAAAILRIAAAHNGGEPGLVIGAAAGGLLTALLAPAEADVFVLGVMGGLLFGLGVQWALRVAIGPTRWRARATELAEIEKPTTPIVLVLSTVNPGLEPQFLQFFKGLSAEDAAMTVEKLAAQAEERILAAADANRM